jgi:peptide/nickel transport system substrate-binding protein
MSDIEQEKLNVASGPQGLSRRRFIQGVAATGIGAGLVGLAACGGDSDGATTEEATDTTAAPVGGPLKIAIGKVANPPTPFTTNDQGSLQILGCVGEYLAWENDKGEVEPRVAESWESTDGGTTWTYKIRQGITFHDGTPLTADDVVWSVASHLDEANASTQAGTFAGVLTAAGVTKVDDSTVQFVCDAPTGALPNLLSSTTYGLVMIKNGEAGGDGWQATMNSCGPWVLESYTEGTGATFTKNANYWDTNRQPAFDTLELIQFDSADAAIAQLATGELDIVSFVSASSVASVDTSIADIVRVPSSGTLMVHMRNDFGPFQDKRIRKAAALTLARADYLSGVLAGEGSLGNDSPTSAYQTLIDSSVPQREKDLEQAKALMEEAGAADGFEVDLSSYSRDDINLLAPYLQSALAEIGITVTIKQADSYYSPPWSSQESKQAENNIWLESNFGITDFGHRGSPDVVLTRVFASTGDWNAAQYKSDDMDAAITTFKTATTPDARKAAATTIQEIALEDSPYIIIYFQTAIGIVRKGLTGFYSNGMAQFETAAVRPA